ncbi:MAG TPA: hypothetical protein PKU93_01240 [Candidatus Pacearchaeota archaeon]|nr:hypothetical protein [Candidatus Pacearchaeota archaeon]
MENRERIFENSSNNFESKKEDIQKRSIEFKESENYEQMEKELSSLFSEKRKTIEYKEDLKEEASTQYDKEIDDLIAVAFTKGPEKAINKACSFNNPFLLDKFHDLLVAELKKRKSN